MSYFGVIPPPTAGDVRLAVEALDWPVVKVDGQTIAGETAWRRVLAAASAAARCQLRAALRDVEGPTEPDAVRRLYLETVTRPTQHEEAAFREAETFVARRGLRIPGTAYVVAWFYGWERSHRGMIFYDRRPFEVLLKTELGDEELFEVACHELRHLADHVLHPGRFDDDAREERAHTFAARALRKRREDEAECARLFGPLPIRSR